MSQPDTPNEPDIRTAIDDLQQHVQDLHSATTRVCEGIHAGRGVDRDLVAGALEPAGHKVRRSLDRFLRHSVGNRRDRPRDDGGDWEYVPEPLYPLPLCIPLPAGWQDDPHYELGAYAYAGSGAMPGQFGTIGTLVRGGELVAQDYDEPFAHAYFGTPGSGKSYIGGVHAEMALLRNRYQNRLLAPLCAISFGYGRHGGGSHLAEQLTARLPNQHLGEVHRLVTEHGTLPEGIEDVVALTLSHRADELRLDCRHVQVLGLKFSCRELGITGLKRLMVMNDRADTLLAEEVSDMIDSLPTGFDKADLCHAARTYRFRNKYVRRVVQKRVRLACKMIDDRCSIRGLLRPGRLIVVEIRDAWLPWTRAMKICQILLDVFVMGEGPPPCNLLLCIDEAHKFLDNAGVRRQVEHIIRERRHLRTSIVLCSQDPLSIPHSTLSELDGVGLFQTPSQRWINHIAKDIVAFSGLSAVDTQDLPPGQMIFWSKRWFQPEAPGELDGGLVRIWVRPRLSHHGGASQRAIA